jgi:hypothetical protein
MRRPFIPTLVGEWMLATSWGFLFMNRPTLSKMFGKRSINSDESFAFPDPGTAAERGARVALLPLATFLELKLASGMTAADRLKDLADVQELIRIERLPRELADRHDPFVRDKYIELWRAVESRR